MGFNKAQVTLIFEELRMSYKRNKFSPDTCFSTDGSGIASYFACKYVKSWNYKRERTATSGKKGLTLTSVRCMRASALYVPPALIFPRKQMAPVLTSSAPTRLNECTIMFHTALHLL
jgi:hypothetical protein